MGKQRVVTAALAAALLGSGFTVGTPTARAEHLEEPQQSPCRPGAPTSETVVGYSDDGPQDDPLRSLPTLYFNETDPDAPYIGACGGGSAGEPIRYIELRLTPGGPYVYASNASGGLAVGQCAAPFAYGPSACAAATSPSGDAHDLVATASASTYEDDNSECNDGCWREYYTTRTATVSQDRVVLETVVVTMRYTPGGESTTTATQRFFVERSPDGQIAIGSEDEAPDDYPSRNCYTRIEDYLYDTAPPAYTENPASNCVGVGGAVAKAAYEVERAKYLAEYLKQQADAYATYVISQVPGGPPTAPSAAACRPTPAAGEVLVPTPASSPVILYANPTAASPYTGACTGGDNGEPIRFVEVRSTAAGPFVSASNGTGGVGVWRCASPDLPVFGARLYGCVGAAGLHPEVPAGVYFELGYAARLPVPVPNNDSALYTWYVFLSPTRVTVGESQTYNGNETYYQERFVRRSQNGHVQIGQGSGDPDSCSWSDYDMANPTAPPTHHEGEPYADCSV